MRIIAISLALLLCACSDPVSMKSQGTYCLHGDPELKVVTSGSTSRGKQGIYFSSGRHTYVNPSKLLKCNAR